MAAKQRLEAMIKARIRPEIKRQLEQIARARDIQLSDVMREALRLYLDQRMIIQVPAESKEEELVSA
jgi:predicted transcriptional regulator